MLRMANENPATYEIGSDAEGSEKDKDRERFQTPEPGKKKLTAAKAAAAAATAAKAAAANDADSEKNEESKTVARSSGSAGLSFGDRIEQVGQQVERPREQEIPNSLPKERKRREGLGQRF